MPTSQELTDTGTPRVRVFDVPQVVAEGEVAPRETLPSFLYLLPDEQRGLRPLRAALAAGSIARWSVPGPAIRARSCQAAWCPRPSRGSATTPWTAARASCPGAARGTAARSPVEASAPYLAHIRDAWNHAMARLARPARPRRFERQAIVLTVPASFDEEARELTVEAAGLERLVLIEEPTAALYAWIAAHRGRLSDLLRDGDRLLICDVGGGTTDFTLVLVRFDPDGEPRFERTAVGHHLLLGGDNLDLALVRHVEEKLGRPKLTLRQQQALRRQCAAAKERLLGPPPAEHVTVSVLGAGASVVGGALSTPVAREEVLALLLDGFLPRCASDATPATERRSGLRELGLPFATDPAITRHLAAFLREAGDEGAPARPDAVLFNGGLLHPGRGTRPRGRGAGPVVRPAGFDVGPACAGQHLAGHGGRRGRGVLRAGPPRAWRSASAAAARAPTTSRWPTMPPRVPDCARRLRAPARGRGRHALAHRAADVHGCRQPAAVLHAALEPHAPRCGRRGRGRRDATAVHRHAPLVTELRFGKRSRQRRCAGGARGARYTEIGTLELWLIAPETGHRWRLQFQLRAATRGPSDEGAASTAAVQPEAVEAATALVRATFAAERRGTAPAARQPDGATRGRRSGSASTRGRSPRCARSPTCCSSTPRAAGARRATRRGGSTCSAIACARASARRSTSGA